MNEGAISVFDFFSGCGGTSKGFSLAGMRIRYALDKDKDAVATFRRNFPRAHVDCGDIREKDPAELEDLVTEARRSGALLFCGCAPCQPFSRQHRNRSATDDRIPLLLEFLRFVEAYLPEYVFVENVPGIRRVDPEAGPLKTFVDALRRLEYGSLAMREVDSCDYGVPQRRRRFILMASRVAQMVFPERTCCPPATPYATVRDWISRYPILGAGEMHDDVRCYPNHAAMKLSPTNLLRIRRTPMGGDHRDWPEDLRLKCHKETKGHTDVYGRLHWDEMAAGLTTKCISYSNGRFGHPEQDRALSAREAAALQTFPDDFVFCGELSSVARQIGNAVPVLLARRMGERIVSTHADVERDMRSPSSHPSGA